MSILNQARNWTAGTSRGNNTTANTLLAGQRAADYAQREKAFWKERGLTQRTSPAAAEMIRSRAYGEALVMDRIRQDALRERAWEDWQRARQKEEARFEDDKRNFIREGWDQVRSMRQAGTPSIGGSYGVRGLR